MGWLSSAEQNVDKSRSDITTILWMSLTYVLFNQGTMKRLVENIYECHSLIEQEKRWSLPCKQDNFLGKHLLGIRCSEHSHTRYYINTVNNVLLHCRRIGGRSDASARR